MLILLLTELFSYIVFRIYNDDIKINYYKDNKVFSNRLRYFNDVGLILPTSGTYSSHYTTEFRDKFIHNDIIGNGSGFVDDGFDEKYNVSNNIVSAITFGDSMTEGTGSTDTIKFGWVELTERKLKKIDIINLGFLGNGINQHIYRYNKLKEFLNHEIVIYNFFSGNDYLHNINDLDYVRYISENYKNWKSNVNDDYNKAENIIYDLNYNFGFKHHLEYLSSYKIRSYTIYLLLKTVDLLNTSGFINTISTIYEYPMKEARTHEVPDYLYKLSMENTHNKKCNEEGCVNDDSLLAVNNQLTRTKIIKFSAKRIDDLYKIVKNDGRKFILVIHPSTRNFIKNLTEFDYNQLDKELVSFLDTDIDYIILKDSIDNSDSRYKSNQIFYKYDGHYTKAGNKIITNALAPYLKSFLDIN